MNARGVNILAAIVLGTLFPALLVLILRNCCYSIPLQQDEIAVYTEPSEALTEKLISVLHGDQSIEIIPIEEYVVSVVLKEMPANFEVEALKAQAVVARTYALRRTERGSKHENADVCTKSSCCQGYYRIDEYLEKGGKQKDVDKVCAAVEATSGLVVTYENKLIDATYFSCSGGVTENAVEVWGTDVPYLRSVESPGEESAKYYVDTVRFSSAEFASRLGLKLGGEKNLTISDITYTEGGGVDTVKICGMSFDGAQLRNLLELRSTAFYITSIGNSVTITTKGFGHRVGMSQYGADAMAIKGAGFQEILLHYYQGTKIISYSFD